LGLFLKFFNAELIIIVILLGFVLDELLLRMKLLVVVSGSVNVG
jgi:hypothetical protein